VEVDQHLLVGAVPVVVLKTHCFSEATEQFDVGDALAGYGDRRLVQRDV
jgi:hypothetical protein